MKYKEFEVEDYNLSDEIRDEKRYRQDKKNRGKHRRDSFEARDRDWGWN